ncbi:hypothetical protein BUALT_Bualt02G0134900 [Buddleja alternifolia]|uniref:Cytochrome P450 n=1 Tax=Buddleja alternifolia TaxID=168488 RepID=A0AAV6Y225_9LAMI|nr:hypothetical protein BUALT_Bualt02G0134900 [Buddleja alternifolia]
MSCDIFMMFSISFIIPLFLFLLMTYKILDMVTTSRLPPGPKKLPIIGNLHQLGKLPHRSLKNLSKIYGDLMFLQLGSVPTLVVSSADMAREIFKTHDRIFSGRPPLYAAKKLTYNFRSIAFAPYGDLWRETRKVLVLELMTVKKVQSFEGIRDQVVTLMMDRIAQATNHIDLSAFALSLSNHVVCSVAFGRKGGVDGEKDGNTTKFHEILHETQNLLGEFNVADYFPKLAWVNKFNGIDKRLDKNFQDLDTLFEKVIEEHLDPKRPKSHHKDMVDVLLEIQKDPNQAITLKNEHIKAVLLVDCGYINL